jgi:hypothetical protein
MPDSLLTLIRIVFWYVNNMDLGLTSTEKAAFTLINNILTAMKNNPIV